MPPARAMQVGKKGLKTTGYQQTLPAENGPGRNFRGPGRSIGDYSSAPQRFFFARRNPGSGITSILAGVKQGRTN
jgi:hypothetical protein